MPVFELVKAPAIQGAQPVAFADLKLEGELLPGDVVEHEGVVYEAMRRMHTFGGTKTAKTSVMCQAIGRIAKEEAKPGDAARAGLIIPGGGR